MINNLDKFNEIVSYISNPSFLKPIKDFIKVNCFLFLDVEENTLEQKELFKEFKKIIENHLLKLYEDKTISKENFLLIAKKGLEDEKNKKYFELLISSKDYNKFKELMIKRHYEIMSLVQKELEKKREKNILSLQKENNINYNKQMQDEERRIRAIEDEEISIKKLSLEEEKNKFLPKPVEIKEEKENNKKEEKIDKKEEKKDFKKDDDNNNNFENNKNIRNVDNNYNIDKRNSNVKKESKIESSKEFDSQINNLNSKFDSEKKITNQNIKLTLNDIEIRKKIENNNIFNIKNKENNIGNNNLNNPNNNINNPYQNNKNIPNQNINNNNIMDNQKIIQEKSLIQIKKTNSENKTHENLNQKTKIKFNIPENKKEENNSITKKETKPNPNINNSKEEKKLERKNEKKEKIKKENFDSFLDNKELNHKISNSNNEKLNIDLNKNEDKKKETPSNILKNSLIKINLENKDESIRNSFLRNSELFLMNQNKNFIKGNLNNLNDEEKKIKQYKEMISIIKKESIKKKTKEYLDNMKEEKKIKELGE